MENPERSINTAKHSLEKVALKIGVENPPAQRKQIERIGGSCEAVSGLLIFKLPSEQQTSLLPPL